MHSVRHPVTLGRTGGRCHTPFVVVSEAIDAVFAQLRMHQTAWLYHSTQFFHDVFRDIQCAGRRPFMPVQKLAVHPLQRRDVAALHKTK